MRAFFPVQILSSFFQRCFKYKDHSIQIKSILSLPLLLMLLLGNATTIQAQKIDAETSAALNNYVDYVNDNIHALWAYHNKFRRFNSDLAIYFIVPHDKRGGREPYFVHEDFLLNNKSYIRPIDHSYVKALKESPAIPPQFRSDLNKQLKWIRRIVEDIVLTSRDIQAYTENRIFANDKNLEDGFEILRRTEQLYDDFNVAKDELYFILEAAFLSYEQPSEDNPYIRHAEQLRALVDDSREVLAQTRYKSKPAVERATEILQKTIKEVSSKEKGSLHGSARLYDPENPAGEDGDLYVRYDFVLQQAQKIAHYGKQYVQSDSLTEKELEDFGPYSPSFYFYNKRMLYSFNRYGRGVVLQYNKFVDSSKVSLLKVVEEAHWFESASIDRFKSEQTELERYIAEGRIQGTKPKKIREKPDPDASPLEGYAANNLIFLLDVSSSMNQPEKIELLKNSVKQLQGLMRPEDHISIIKYSGDATVVLPPTSSTEKEAIFKAIDNLRPGGKSDVGAGLKLAYSVMEKHFITSGNNKIILASDGDFDVRRKMLRLIKSKGDEERMLSIFYFGRVEKQELKVKLEGMTRAGSGNYSYVKQENANAILLEEARRIRN